MTKHENPFGDLFDYTEEPFDMEVHIALPIEDAFDKCLNGIRNAAIERAKDAFKIFSLEYPEAKWEDCHWVSWHGHCTERRFLDDRGGLTLKRGDQYVYSECTWLS